MKRAIFLLLALMPLFSLAASSNNNSVVITPSTSGTEFSGNISSDLITNGGLLKITQKNSDKNSFFITFQKWPFTAQGLILNNNYDAIALANEETQSPLLPTDKKIESVTFNLPRNVNEGIFPGETIVINWRSKNIKKDEKVTVSLFAFIDGVKSKTASFSKQVENTESYSLPIPSDLLKTTEPDYKPYMAEVKYDEKIKASSAGFFYIKHLNCPVFSIADLAIENQALVQKVFINDPGTVVRGQAGILLKEAQSTDNGKTIQFGDTVQLASSNRVQIDFLKDTDFILKTGPNVKLKPGQGYYAYIKGDFWDAEDNLFDLCVIRRQYFVVPSDIWKNQEKKILPGSVNISGSSPGKIFKTGEKITVKWQTIGIKPTEKVFIWTEPTSKIHYPKTGQAHPYMSGRSPLAIQIANSGSYAFTIGKDLSNQVAYTAVGFQETKVSDNVTSKPYTYDETAPFLVDTAQCPTIQVIDFLPSYYGVKAVAKIINWAGKNKYDIALNSRRIWIQGDPFLVENEQNLIVDPATGKTKDIGFDSKKFTLTPSNPQMTILFPRNDELTKMYPGKTLYQPSRRYKNAFKLFDESGNQIQCPLPEYTYDVPNVYGMPDAKAEDLGFTILSDGIVEVLGKVTSQGFSKYVGVAPVVEATQDINDFKNNTGNTVYFSANGSIGVEWKKFAKGQSFRIKITDYNVAKGPVYYRLCVRDYADLFYANVPKTKDLFPCGEVITVGQTNNF